MKRIMLIPAICILCVSCTGNSNNMNGKNQEQAQPADWDITAHVKETLVVDGSLSTKARLISVTTNDGVVTLTGTVVSEEESRKVVKIVEGVPGVKSVVNQLTIVKPQ